MVTNTPILHTPRSWGWGGSGASDTILLHVLRLNEGDDLERSKHRTTPRPDMEVRAFESRHNFPVHSSQDDISLFNSPNVDVGSRSRNTNFLFLTLVLAGVVVLREESDTRTEEETIQSHHQACLLPYPPLLTLVYTALARARQWYYLRGLRSLYCGPIASTDTGSPFVSTHPGSPFASTGTGPPFPQAPIDTARLHEFGYRHAPLPSSSVPTGPPHPVQLRSRWALLPRPTTWTSPSSPAAERINSRGPPSFQCCCGWGKEERALRRVTDTASVIYHPGLRRSAGVGVGGLGGVCDVPMDTKFQGILQVWSARVQTVREIPLAPMETFRRKLKEAATPLHHHCPGTRTAMVDLLLSHRLTRLITTSRSAGADAGVGGSTNGIGGIAAYGPTEQKHAQDPGPGDTSLTPFNDSDLTPPRLKRLKLRLDCPPVALDPPKSAGPTGCWVSWGGLGRREEAVEEREKEVRGGEEKIAEPEQGIDKRERVLDQRGP
ncbi:uncharacterized protein LACBIDRAFT_330869 [Laccaria bicolor S238N-H82]|uniref:Predicted protein n=1 Tax=Laccaria bicolor (strain S238N-H82 / ATCC MYA-4686) TaxID=486041 RepID=B0DN08_LACBS|nr:uncharacterized protein LACBIDRAFT_330869 [Laccaria bicolor S238N-H82]EDR04065.1 predicted protein [Laccaria bicolor S238N-H82]|eukprot:XP_001885320.1 predicted protein [Laccaria bicolor S238N-H82]